MIRRLITFAGLSALIYLAIALGLVVSQRPGPLDGQGGGLDFTGVLGASTTDLPIGVVRLDTSYQGADGARLPMVVYRQPRRPKGPILIAVHGSGWHGQQFERLATALLPGSPISEIRLVTLRGHGEHPARRGDVDYIGQFEDDLAAMISRNRKDRAVILLGHSSGGGLVVRMAGGRHGPLIDRAILIAPFLQYDAPTTRLNSGGWAHPLTRRIIGLGMLNAVGIHALDHLTAIQFAMPRAVLDGPLGHTATTAYSWRLNQSFAPRRNWQADVAALPEFLLIAGAEDEAFDAAAYQPTLAPLNPDGRYVLVPGAGHLDIIDHPATLAAIRAFLP